MPVSPKKRPSKKRAARLPVPDAVGVTDGDDQVVAWDLRATHAFLREQGWPSDCTTECRERRCIMPLQHGVFRHMLGAAQGVGDFDELAVARWLDDNPHPMIVLPNHVGHYEPLPGMTVVDVVRAAITERSR